MNSNSRPRSVAIGALALAVVVGACGGLGGESKPVVLVLAASSLTDAFEAMETAFETAYPDLDVVLSLAGSSTLREQILEGAPGDVFASADPSNMDLVTEGNGVATEPVIFASNRLAIGVPADNSALVTGLEDFARSELLIGLCAETVPCGEFGREALARAGVEPSVDTNEPDVRALLTKLEAGELDAGIIYVTDVASAGGTVEGIDIPDEYNVTADYPIAVLADAPNLEGARVFVDFVTAEQGQSILSEQGFVAP